MGRVVRDRDLDLLDEELLEEELEDELLDESLEDRLRFRLLLLLRRILWLRSELSRDSPRMDPGRASAEGAFVDCTAGKARRSAAVKRMPWIVSFFIKVSKGACACPWMRARE